MSYPLERRHSFIVDRRKANENRERQEFASSPLLPHCFLAQLALPITRTLFILAIPVCCLRK